MYAPPHNVTERIKDYNWESDTYTNVDDNTDRNIKLRHLECCVCGRLDERTKNPMLKVLCREDRDGEE